MLIAVGSTCVADDATDAAGIEFFEKHVRPVLAEHCYSCHSGKAAKLKASLRVDSRQALLDGGDSGASIVPGVPDDSLLMQAVLYESYEMPPDGKLSDDKIDALRQWIAMGAPWPEEAVHDDAVDRPTFDLQQRALEHWVWRPISAPSVPEVSAADWPFNAIDHFVLKPLDEAGLQPAADADRSALARRLYFDLTGLPPTAEQLQMFLNDDDADATEKLVDQLLKSPRFGERWGRHWLDLVRYAESRGHEFDNDARNAYQYRDYVIRAFNADVPYDQWVREHIAGDLLEDPRLHPEQGFNESILGTGFWFLGEWVHSPVDIRKDESDRFDNMIDVMSKTFLGVTVACARCHDHKFDAISTADYYALSGYLQSSDYREARFESMSHNNAIAERIDELDGQYESKIRSTLEGAGVDVSPLTTATITDGLPEATVAIDYSSLEAGRYLQDGFIFGKRPRYAGELMLADNEADAKGPDALKICQQTAAVNDPVWNGLKTIHEQGVHARSTLTNLPRSGRTLRSPTFELTSGNLKCRVEGAGHVVACVDSHRLVAGPLHGETVAAIKPGQTWVSMRLDRYVGHRVHLEWTPDENQSLSVHAVLQDPTADQMKQVDQALTRQAADATTRQAAIDAWLQSDSDAVQSVKEMVAKWSEERSALQQRIRYESQAAMAMMDGTGEDDHVLIRGNSSKPGDLEPRHFLTAISGNKPMPIESGSGRLQLAERINDPENPLTHRVIVNRIWHHLMGRGIVPTTDDFGVLGQRPSHPELLDHLATEFRGRGRSIKQMIRYIVLSRTYHMSSFADPRANQIDPNNVLLHHRSPRRLEGEAIRDALLSISGRLDETMFGPPVPIHLTRFMDGRGRPGVNGPLDGNGRRSIYISVRRNFLSPFMLAFDTPVPFSTMGRRNNSNVPAQALILMNDPFVVEQAGKWADRAMSQIVRVEGASDIDGAIRWMYQTAFARDATAQELDVAKSFLTSSSVATSEIERQRWVDFAHALINTKEFIFLR
ncbi:MAG: PSD1 and planctomycete cytochrome C domain-containing protein [Pirellulaceae bacterium]